ncbi:unnamed protein product [Caenorhabditis nigoni]
MMTSSSGIEVTLTNADLWKKFPSPMEMMLTKPGRKMLPILEYSIEGLNPTATYEIYLHMERMDDHKYRYVNKEWDDYARGDPITPIQKIKHKSGGQTGMFWMDGPISFEQIRLTNNPDLDKKDHIYLQSMHKWRPVVTVRKLGNGDGNSDYYEEFRVENVWLVAVTVYQNPVIKRLKIENNKLPSGFRSTENSNIVLPTREIEQSSMATTLFGVKVSLSNADLWKKFPSPMEMMLNKPGRKMFPILEYSIEGLNPTAIYEICLHMERMDDYKYRYVNNEWYNYEEGDPITPIRNIKHKSGRKPGMFWMDGPISFEQIRLTNNPDTDKKDNIFIQSMHKWRPVVTIRKMEMRDGYSYFYEEFRMKEVWFMAVTYPQNPAIKRLRIENNSFAFQFRETDYPGNILPTYSSLTTTSYGIKVSLSNADLWKKFPSPMEMMLVRKIGRKLFPILEYSIEGLNPTAMYEVYLHMERMDEYKYRYVNNEWYNCEEGDPITPIQKIIHKSGRQTGIFWMDGPISFEQIRLTNNHDLDKKDHVFIQSMHKWRPVVTIRKLENGDENSIYDAEFRMEDVWFIAVTAFKNPTTKRLKIENNIYASGFHTARISSDAFPTSSSSTSSSSSMNLNGHSTIAHPFPNSSNFDFPMIETANQYSIEAYQNTWDYRYNMGPQWAQPVMEQWNVQNMGQPMTDNMIYEQQGSSNSANVPDFYDTNNFQSHYFFQ